MMWKVYIIYFKLFISLGIDFSNVMLCYVYSYIHVSFEMQFNDNI